AWSSLTVKSSITDCSLFSSRLSRLFMTFVSYLLKFANCLSPHALSCSGVTRWRNYHRHERVFLPFVHCFQCVKQEILAYLRKQRDCRGQYVQSCNLQLKRKNWSSQVWFYWLLQVWCGDLSSL